MSTETERFDRKKCSCEWEHGSSGTRGPMEDVARDVDPRLIKFDPNCEEKGKPGHPVDFGA